MKESPYGFYDVILELRKIQELLAPKPSVKEHCDHYDHVGGCKKDHTMNLLKDNLAERLRESTVNPIKVTGDAYFKGLADEARKWAVEILDDAFNETPRNEHHAQLHWIIRERLKDGSGQ